MLTKPNQFISEQLEGKTLLLLAFLEMYLKSTGLVIFQYQALPFVLKREEDFFPFGEKKIPQSV